jgi:hypothetical protein
MGTSYNPKIVTDGLVLNLDPANVKSYPAGQDPFVNNVSLMLDGESLTDKSQNSVAVTVEGSVIVDSSFKKVGNSSLKFGGALADGLTVPSSSLFAFPGDFTIEFWTYANQWGQRSGATVYFCNGVLNQFQLAVYPATQIELYFNGSSFINVPLSASIVGRWMHIALVRSGSTITIYENGTSVGSGTSSYSVPASICYIGKQLPRSPTNYGHNLDGYIDDLKITKGARYTANFTPPTAPLSLPGVVTDLTKNRVVGTLTNGPTYSAGAITTDGVDDYINCGNYANANFGTSNFTINMWIKTTSTTGGTILAKSTGDSANVSYGWLIYLNATSSGEIGFATATAAGAFSASGNYIIRTSGASVNNGAWKMVTVVADRSLANVSIYINGVLQTLTTWIFATASLATVGNITNSQVLCIGNESDFNVPANATFSLVQLYNKALTLNEIRQNFNAAKGRFGL